MYQFRFKVSEKVYNIKCLVRSNESDYNKINAIYDKIFSFNDGFKSIDFISKNYAHRSNITRIESDKMRFIERFKVLLNMSYDILLSICPIGQNGNSVSLNLLVEVKKMKKFLDSPNEKNYKEILKFIRKINLNFSEYINNLSNNSESYHKKFQFISALNGLLGIIKNLVESEKISYNTFSGFIKYFCASDQEKIPEQLNICYKHLNKNYQEYLY